MSRRREIRSRRMAVRILIREYERVSARFVRALRANDSSAALAALVSLRAFVDEGIAWHTRDAGPERADVVPESVTEHVVT